NRDAKVYYHILGEEQTNDRLIFEIPEHPERGIHTSVTDDGRYAILSIYHGTERKNRIYYMDLADPAHPKVNAPIVKLLDAFDASYQPIGNDGSVFYFRTDNDAAKGRVIAVDLTNPDKSAWKTLVPETTDTLQWAQLIQDELVLDYLNDAHSK